MNITDELLARAADMKEEGIGGWADTCIAAAGRIAELEAWSQLLAGTLRERESHITTDNSAVIRALEAEIAEQARLLDMSASREAKLLARIKELENGP